MYSDDIHGYLAILTFGISKQHHFLIWNNVVASFTVKATGQTRFILPQKLSDFDVTGMPYPVSVNLPTPKELAVAAQTARESTWGMRYPPQRLPPLPGWIRVKFYSHIYKIRYEMLPDMEGEVMLDSSGGLDTRRVCKMWNLEACAPIDPMRWVQFERPDPNWLSPLAVHVLSERNKCLVFSPNHYRHPQFTNAHSAKHLYTSKHPCTCSPSLQCR
ncbi:hypothetical protein BDP27DRAFT_1035093 [Rhodocollybia butyracea]|uniref:Uncharacterized protein n=1 Tax=Rhodocollybia butyracea TaxID=206335 RepID=A0A9P5UDR7_9AGAR|nr:hypothetical protein BDP27DRAFT_1035093 [Rhodocollybia butyracea]